MGPNAHKPFCLSSLGAHRVRSRNLAAGFFCLAAMLGAVASHALDAGDVAKIVNHIQIKMPFPVNGIYGIRTLKVDVVGTFKDADGSEFLRVEGVTAADGMPQTVLIDGSGDTVEVGLVLDSVNFADLGTSISQLRRMAEAGEGALKYEGNKYNFSAAVQSQFSSQAGANPAKLNYFILQCEEDSDLSLMVLVWGDKVEVLQNERIDATQVELL